MSEFNWKFNTEKKKIKSDIEQIFSVVDFLKKYKKNDILKEIKIMKLSVMSDSKDKEDLDGE
jgi:hypothetical protein